MNLNDIKLVQNMIFLIIFNIIVAASLLFTGYYIKRNPHAQFKDPQFDKSEFIEQYGIGIAIGEIKKGYFSTDTLGNIKLIVHKDKKPFLHIETENKRHIIINFRDPNKTLEIYNSIMLYHKQ